MTASGAAVPAGCKRAGEIAASQKQAECHVLQHQTRRRGWGWGGVTSPGDSRVGKGRLRSRAEPWARHGALPLRRPSENQFARLNRQRFGFKAVIALRAVKEPSTSSLSGKGTLSYGGEPGGDLPFRLSGEGGLRREMATAVTIKQENADTERDDTEK